MDARGKLKKEETKSRQFGWRISDVERGKLERLRTETGKPMSQILSDALDIYYRMFVENY